MVLSTCRTLVRQRADMENSQFVTDAEVNNYINASYGELYDLLVSRFEDYYFKVDGSGAPPQFTLTGGVGGNAYALPSDFYKERGLDFLNSGSTDWITVSRFNFAERNSRNRARNRVLNGVFNISYRIMGGYLYVLPEDQSAGTYRHWYIPRLALLSADSDVIAGVMDFEEYIVVDAAIKCLLKEESDAGALMAIKEQLKQRILAMSSNRDAGQNDRISDVTDCDAFEGLFPR